MQTYRQPHTRTSAHTQDYKQKTNFLFIKIQCSQCHAWSSVIAKDAKRFGDTGTLSFINKVQLELDRRCTESVDFSRVDGSLVGSLVSVDKAGTQPGCQKH